MKYRLQTALLFTVLNGFWPSSAQQAGAFPAVVASSTSGVLSVEEAAKLMPATVFFKGQSAPIQARNSSGVRFTSKALMLAALVDTSGYSSQVQERYQAYLITETPLSIDGHFLPAGAYGVGFVPGDSFVVMDLGGNDIFIAHSVLDGTMRRPRPLEILDETGKPDAYRLYEGRRFISFHQETPQR